MIISAKIASFVFTGDTKKDAYLNGCKSLSKYIASKKCNNLTFKTVWINETEIQFILYAAIDANAEQKQFCKMCKEIHCSFFVNEEYNCNRCNLKSYLKRLNQRVNVSKGYYKGVMKKH